jgi:chromosomal replication initiator protein
MLDHPQQAAEAIPQTFRTFVTGPQNALAYNAALTVARTPGAVYNPLYLTSGPGLGKSHLLRAIAAYLRPRLNGAEVIVVGGDAFAQDFVTHLRRGHMLAFRRRYRRAGALLIDGVAVLAGRETAAEELVHTIDALREANRQIVIADEQRPAAMRGLPERLRSRLGASLIVALGSPDEATRLAILRQKYAHWSGAHAERGGVSEDALAALAGRVRGSVRDLEAALARLTAEAAARGTMATPPLAVQVAAEINRAARQPRGRARVEAVIQAVCDYYGLSRSVLLGKSREMTVAQARQVAMYLLREDAGLTATQVGQELGRDHSTVLHGHARIATALNSGDTLMSVVLDSIRKSVLQAHRDTA